MALRWKRRVVASSFEKISEKSPLSPRRLYRNRKREEMLEESNSFVDGHRLVDVCSTPVIQLFPAFNYTFFQTNAHRPAGVLPSIIVFIVISNDIVI